MESSEKTRAYISWDTNLHQQADFWQGAFFILVVILNMLANLVTFLFSVHLSFAVLYSAQVDEWVQANLMLGREVTLQWTSILSRGGGKDKS